jgi:predicted ATPase
MYISSFSISGYRSLKEVKITDMKPVCIFHGPNNSGKSNILSALETIFRRKLLIEETVVGDVTQPHERQGSFWLGRITQFRDNFYGGGKEDIAFEVSVTLSDTELTFLREILTQLHNSLGKLSKDGGHDKVLKLAGRIKYVDEDTADLVLERAVFNTTHVVFEIDATGKRNFFPKLAKLTAEQRLGFFEQLMNLVNDSFALVPSDRYLTTEIAGEEPKDGPALVFSSKTFKHWLFKLSLSRSGHAAFEEIKGMFAKDPFSIGEIGFSKESNEIEIMVKEPKVRLPIGRLGSGHQQFLYIIAMLVLNKGKMLGIEELEVNLSPEGQKMIFEKLKDHIYKGGDLVSQIIITSHSDYFQYRGDVRVYGVEHTGDHTKVNSWTRSQRKQFFPHS